MATNRYHHLAIIGTYELHFFGRDDRYVKRAVARWLRLFWDRARANAPGSMAHAINNGLDRAPECEIGRWRLDSTGCSLCLTARAARLERFDVCTETILEFSRVWD